MHGYDLAVYVRRGRLDPTDPFFWSNAPLLRAYRLGGPRGALSITLAGIIERGVRGAGADDPLEEVLRWGRRS